MGAADANYTVGEPQPWRGLGGTGVGLDGTGGYAAARGFIGRSARQAAEHRISSIMAWPFMNGACLRRPDTKNGTMTRC